MESQVKKSNKKKWMITGIIGGIVLIAAVVLIIVFTTKKEDGYRTIQIYEMEGDAVLTRKDVGEMEAYENLMLKSGDKVNTRSNSSLRLKMDSDKFMLMDPDTEVELFATGDSKNSKTNINLNAGAVTVEIKNKLNKDSTYRITTPNSVMAVRGTVFRVEVTYDENGKCITRVMVFEGSVTVEKKEEDGTLSEKVILEAGQQAIIKEEDGVVKIIVLDEIDYEELPLEVLEFLKEIVKGGTKLCISLEELERLIKTKKGLLEENKPEASQEPYQCTVTFMYDGKVFGTQEVMNGELVQIPKLIPDAEGQWDYDFEVPVVTDIAIEFK